MNSGASDNVKVDDDAPLYFNGKVLYFKNPGKDKPHFFNSSTRKNSTAKKYYNLHDDHLRCGKKVFTRLKLEKVVKILGASLPCKERRDGIQDKEEDFYLQILLLHYPHQERPLSLHNDGYQYDSWREMYEDKKEKMELGVECQHFIDFHEDRWATKLRGEEGAKRFRAVQEELDSTVVVPKYKTGGGGNYLMDQDFFIPHVIHDECSDDEDIDDDEDTNSDADNYVLDEYDALGIPDDTFYNNPDQYDDEDAKYTYPKEHLCLPQFTKHIDMDRYNKFDKFEAGMSKRIDKDESAGASTHAIRMDAAHMIVTVLTSFSKLITDAITQGTSGATITGTTGDTYEALRLKFIKVQHPEIAFSNTKTIKITVSPDLPLVDLHYYATLQEVATVFKFNQADSQERAFFLGGEALLKEFAKDEAEYTANNCEEEEDLLRSITEIEQFLLLLHGLGGSGKSYIIRALTALAQSWLRPNSIFNVCQSGIGAVNINGITVCSFKNKNKKYLDQVKVILFSHRFLVISELKINDINHFLFFCIQACYIRHYS
jgi:hypothetical protein